MIVFQLGNFNKHELEKKSEIHQYEYNIHRARVKPKERCLTAAIYPPVRLSDMGN